MSEIVMAALGKALLVFLEALIVKLAIHAMRSMRYRQSPAMA